MNDDQLTDLWVGAFRYYCGRATIAVHSFCESLIEQWENIPRRAKFVIIRDLTASIDDDTKARKINDTFLPLGMDMDRKKWLEVAQAIGCDIDHGQSD